MEQIFGLGLEQLKLLWLLGLDDGLIQVYALLVDYLDSRIVVLEFLKDYEVALLPEDCLLVLLLWQDEDC